MTIPQEGRRHEDDDSSGARPRAHAWVLAAAAVSLCLVGGCSSSTTDDTTPACVQPIESTQAYAGKSFDEWTAEWWRWFYRAPGSTHPEFDPDGRYCNVAQDPASPVFFMTGGNNGASTRTCPIPAGKAILFGMQNGEADNACLTMGLATAEKLRTDNQTFLDTIDRSSIKATFDGCSLESRAYKQSPFSFSYTVPAGDNVYLAQGVNDCKGVVDPAFSAGYWIMLPPLKVGQHKLDFSGQTGAPFNFKAEAHRTLDVK